MKRISEGYIQVIVYLHWESEREGKDRNITVQKNSISSSVHIIHVSMASCNWLALLLPAVRVDDVSEWLKKEEPPPPLDQAVASWINRSRISTNLRLNSIPSPFDRRKSAIIFASGILNRFTLKINSVWRLSCVMTVIYKTMAILSYSLKTMIKDYLIAGGTFGGVTRMSK